MSTIAVIGPGEADDELDALGEEVGEALGRGGATLVCGGLGGVMAAACRGAKRAGALTVGILPGIDRGDANPWVDVALPTGMGEGRNVLVVRAADAVVAVDGEYGTLSEMALALKIGVPVVGLRPWELSKDGVVRHDVIVVADAAEAAERALALAASATHTG